MAEVFPFDQLKAETGKIWALLFENDHPNVQLARGVFWALEVQFAPIEGPFADDGSALKPCVTAEWIPLGIRDWRELGSLVLDAETVTEASIYIHEHHWIETDKLSLTAAGENQFDVEWAFQLGDDEPFRDAAGQPPSVRAKVRAPFEGINVHFGLIPGEEGREAEVLDALQPFVDLSSFEPPILSTNQFGVTSWDLPPKL